MKKLSLKSLFLIDGLGALVSAISLGVVLVQLESWVGMPPPVLYPLAGIAGLFALYSLSCFFFLKGNRSPFLKGIAIANLLYCGLTLGAMIFHAEHLRPLGWTYFAGELVIVVGLAVLELKMASDPTKN